MIVLNVFIAVIQVFIFIHLLEEIVSLVRNKKLQKEWADEKEMRLKCTPKIHLCHISKILYESGASFLSLLADGIIFIFNTWKR